jgi:hypothetical protein
VVLVHIFHEHIRRQPQFGVSEGCKAEWKSHVVSSHPTHLMKIILLLNVILSSHPIHLMKIILLLNVILLSIS